MQTIAARLTPPGRAALATIGLRGPAALALAGRLFSRRIDLKTAASDRQFFGRFGAAVQDEVVLRVVCHQPVAEVEVHCHGGPAVVEAILHQLADRGVSIVDWRTYLDERGDSTIAVEAAEALNLCATARCARVLLDQAQGALERSLEEFGRSGNRALLEGLLHWSRFGLHLTEPWKVLLFGRTNVGKSRLLNALAGFARAIVAPTAGTTRDLVRVRTALAGWPVEICDGAGFSESPQKLEQAGLELLLRERAHADLAVMVVDLAEPARPLDHSLRRDLAPNLVVGNKADLALAWSEDTWLDLRVSARTGAGIDAVAELFAARLVPETPPDGAAVPFTARQVRHIEALLNWQ